MKNNQEIIATLKEANELFYSAKQSIIEYIDAKKQEIQEKIDDLPEPAKTDKWSPPEGDWSMDLTGRVFYGDSSNYLKMYGAQFDTEEQAERAIKIISRQLWLFHLAEELNGDWVADWGNDDQVKYVLVFNTTTKQWSDDGWIKFRYEVVTFSQQAAKKACEWLNTGYVVLP